MGGADSVLAPRPTRLDAIHLISKEPSFPDAPVVKPGFLQPFFDLVCHGVRIHEHLAELNRETFSSALRPHSSLCRLRAATLEKDANILRVGAEYDVMTVGETGGSYNPADYLKYIHPDRKELNQVFQCSCIFSSCSCYREKHPAQYRAGVFNSRAAGYGRLRSLRLRMDCSSAQEDRRKVATWLSPRWSLERQLVRAFSLLSPSFLFRLRPP